MKINDNIEDELQSLSPMLAGIKNINVFTTSTGYFDKLSITIIDTVKNTDSKYNSGAGNSSSVVPNGYFDNLAKNIIQKIKTEKLKKDNETRDEFSVLLNNLPKKNVFELPVNYFDSLVTEIRIKINFRENNTDELQHIAPLLYSCTKENLGEAPAGYFDNLSATIIKKIASKSPGKVVTMEGRLHFVKYAVAAIFIGVISMIALNFYNKPANINIKEFASLDSIIEKGKAMDETKFNETLNNLSQEDIINYLQKTATEADVTLLSTSINENVVPSQEEYLLNDKTLDNFINDINTRALNN